MRNLDYTNIDQDCIDQPWMYFRLCFMTRHLMLFLLEWKQKNIRMATKFMSKTSNSRTRLVCHLSTVHCHSRDSQEHSTLRSSNWWVGTLEIQLLASASKYSFIIYYCENKVLCHLCHTINSATNKQISKSMWTRVYINPNREVMVFQQFFFFIFSF